MTTGANTLAVVPNEGKYFQSLNRGKRGLVVDLQRPAGRALIHRMSKSPTAARRHAPVFGADTAEVLLEAGIGADEIAALMADGTTSVRRSACGHTRRRNV